MSATPSSPRGQIGRRTAVALAGVFLLIVAAPPLHQMSVELGAGKRWAILSLFDEFPTAASLKAFEDQLSRDSWLAARLRVRYQTLLTRGLGRGTEKVVVGRDGFLFFRRELDMVIGPGFLAHRASVSHARIEIPGARKRKTSDPLAAIVDYHRQLAARGVHLVFAPLPVKPIIYPDKLWAGYPMATGPAWNPDRALFLSQLRAAGVDVLDLTDALWSARGTSPEPLFLKLDTHWSPRGLALAADGMARHLGPHLPNRPSDVFYRVSKTITNHGDLFRMMELPASEDLEGLLAAEHVDIDQIRQGAPGSTDGPLFRGNDQAPILLLGDSFTNVYHRSDLGWGEGAGLGEQLAERLGVPVHILAIDGGGATSVRERLAAIPGALVGKKIVVWACSARDLFDDGIDWDLVPLPDEEVP